MKDWVSLHNHTMYSLLDGCGRISDFVAYAKEINFKSLAITDHGTCAGFLDFQALCQEHGIKPIFGLECYISPFETTLKGLTDEEKADENKDYKNELKVRSKNFHLVLLAKNNTGLKTLYNVITTANMVGFYRRPRIDYDFLSKNHEGLICTSACLASKLNNFIMAGDDRGVESEINFMKSVFKDDYYLELEAHNMEEQKIINKKLIELSKKHGIKTIFANDAHYINADYKKAHAALIKINSDSDWTFSAEDLYLMNYDEFFNHIKKNHGYMKDDIIEEALKNTNEIADKCNAIIDVKSKKEPIYTNTDNIENIDFLIKLMLQGSVAKKLDRLPIDVDKALETEKIRKFKFYYPEVKNMRKFYFDRLQYEFKIIKDKGFIDYFLIVWDFIKNAKDNGILIGPGRGSVGGSLLAWIIGLIELDPIEYKLSFERFLNPARSKSPDIDTDIEDEKRDEVRNYLSKKWGENCIAPIVAYSRYSANSLFRDVCKLYGMEFMEYNEIAKTIDTGDMEAGLGKLKSFQRNLEENEKLQKFINKLDKGEEIVDLVTKMEGQIKNTSIAAAGTIISNQPLQELLPLRRAKDKSLVTEWEGTKLSSCGFLKMDLLGLRTLTVLKDCLKMVNKDIDFLYTLPMNDPQVYKYFEDGKTLGIFQFESSGITGLLKKVCPKSIEDIAICSALYRPGPITHGLLADYINRRSGAAQVSYIHKVTEDILKDTLGILVYQEQIIDVFNKLGLTYGEADLLRRAIDSYNFKEMDEFSKKIREKKLLRDDELDILIEDIKTRAGYSFNKSHAIEYAIVSYWCMYFKYYYPSQFCLANLNRNLDDKEKVDLYITMAETELNRQVYYGDINDFRSVFEIVDGTICYGYGSLKYLSLDILEKIISIRKEKPFTSVEDFLVRCTKIKKNVVKILIDIGMLDKLKIFEKSEKMLDRCKLYKYYELYQKYHDKTKKDLASDTIIKGNFNNIFTEEFLNFHKVFDVCHDAALIREREETAGFLISKVKMMRSFKTIKDDAEQAVKQKYTSTKKSNPYRPRRSGDVILAFVDSITEQSWKKNGKSGKMFTIKLIDKKDAVYNALAFDIKDIELFDLLVAELEEESDKSRRLLLGHKKI